MVAFSCAALVLLVHPALAWQTTKDSAAQKDSSYIDADGTAHITRVVPLPATISPRGSERIGSPGFGCQPEPNSRSETHRDRRCSSGRG